MLRGKTVRNKGNSLLETVSDYMVIDIETTGFDPFWDEIIEVAVLKVRNYEVVDHFQSLIDPEIKIDEFITLKTGITNKMVRGKPTISDIIPELFDFIGNDIILGHNVNFDINFLYDCSEGYKVLNNDFVDFLRLSRRIYPDFEDHRLDTIMVNLGIPDRKLHRSLNDCYVTNECYIHTVNHIQREGIVLKDLFKKKHEYVNYSKFAPLDPSNIDPDHECYGKHFCFTGALENLTRNEAAQIVANFGGIIQNSVTKETTYLVLGNFDYVKLKGDKSTKQRKAEELYLKGHEIHILSENVFFGMIEDALEAD